MGEHALDFVPERVTVQVRPPQTDARFDQCPGIAKQRVEPRQLLARTHFTKTLDLQLAHDNGHG